MHGSRCSRASSECYVLHPELKPNKRSAEADVAEGEAEVPIVESLDFDSHQ